MKQAFCGTNLKHKTQHAKDEQLRQQQIQLLSNQLADIEPIATVLYSELEAEYDELSNLENLMQAALSQYHG